MSNIAASNSDPKRSPAMTSNSKWGELTRLILGSKSWSRRTLLETLNVPSFELMTADIDEDAAGGDAPPRELVLRIGLAKARALIPQIAPPVHGKTLLVCGDSVVTHKGMVLGKPETHEQAREILRSYADAPATTVSSIVVVDVTSGLHWSEVDEAEVYLRPFPSDVIEELILKGRAMESAGALLIEHPLVEQHTECIIGERSSVMGFPTVIAERLLLAALSGVGGKELSSSKTSAIVNES